MWLDILDRAAYQGRKLTNKIAREVYSLLLIDLLVE